MIDKHGQYWANLSTKDNITFIRGAECAAYLERLRVISTMQPVNIFVGDRT